MIPRTIHQIYLAGDLPAPLQRNVDDLKGRNLGWRHRLWDASQAESHIRAFYGEEMLRAYRMIDPAYGAARSDFLRHLILHSFGGVYFDIKSGSTLPLDQVLRSEDAYVLAQWPQDHPCFYPHRELSRIAGGEFVSFFIASEPGHAFSTATICRVLDNIRAYRAWSGVGRNGTLRLTGPIAYTLAVHSVIKKHPHRFAAFDELGLYASIDYDHGAAFPNHYSTLDYPVVKIGAVGTSVSRLVNPLRDRLRLTLQGRAPRAKTAAPELKVNDLELTGS